MPPASAVIIRRFRRTISSRVSRPSSNEYRLRLDAAQTAGDPVPEFPEQLVAGRIDNTWHDAAEGIVGNWIGLVYQLTHEERKLPFMDGVDLHNPLGLDWITGSHT